MIDSTCPYNQIPDGNGGCKCRDGFYYDEQAKTCIYGSPCPPNSFRNNFGFCQCELGYIQNAAGLCVRCTNG